jgi:hypothetical protein
MCAALLAVPLAVGFATPAHAATTGTLTVSLTDFTGAPLPGARVVALNQTTVSSSGALTDLGGGNYSTVLPTGSYKVRVSAPGGLQQFVPGQTTVGSATAYTIADGQTTAISEQLLPSGNLQISLVDRATSAPVNVGCVTLTTTLSKMICDQPDGQYRWIGVPLGTAQVSVADTKTEWPAQQSITVTAGADDVQVALDPAAAIRTTVQASTDATVHPAACVDAVYPGANGAVNYGCTQATDGSLLIGPLAAASVQLFARPSDPSTYGVQWVGPNGGTGDQRQAIKVNTVLGTVTTIPPIRFDGAGSITGSINGSRSVVNIQVLGGQDGARYLGTGSFFTLSTDQYTYTLSGLGPYAWPIDFGASEGGFADQWSGNAPDRYSAVPVMVVAGLTTYYNVTLSQESFLHGTVQMTAGSQPANWYTVSARNAITGDDIGQSSPGVPGASAFQIGGLNSDPVMLRVQTDSLMCQAQTRVLTSGLTDNPVVLTIASPTTCGPLVPSRTLPPVLTSTPVSVVNPSAGRSEVFAASNTDLVARGWNPTGGWSDWTNLGGGIVGSPAVLYNPRFGTTEVYARTGANHLEYRYLLNGTWSNWTDLGGDVADDPAVLYNPRFGTTEVYVRTSVNHLAYRYWSNGWSNWIDLGGDLASSPSMIFNPRFGTTEAYMRTRANHLVYRYWSNGWSNWIDLAGDLAGRPGVIYNPRYGTTEAYVRTNSAHIQYRYWSNGWSDWNDQGGNATSDPTVVYVPPVATNVPAPLPTPSTEVYTTVGGQVVENDWYTGWSGWTNVGGNTASGVTATYNPLNTNIDAYLTSPDGYLYQRDWIGTTHTAGWVNLSP